MLRRAALALAFLWPAAAWADVTGDASGVALKAADNVMATGPVASVLLLYGIVVTVAAILLWRAKSASDLRCSEYQEKRLSDTASYIERISKVGTDASAAITGNNAQVAELVRLINAIFDLVKTVPPLIMQTKADVDDNGGRTERLAEFLRGKLGGEK